MTDQPDWSIFDAPADRTAEPPVDISGLEPAANLPPREQHDDGNALRLVDAFSTYIRYVPQRGEWLAWNGHRWQWDEAGQIRELARRLARALPRNSKEGRQHRNYSLSARALSNMLRLAETDGRIVADLTTLDADPFILNTPAGPVNLMTGLLSPRDPAQLHTRSTTVEPDLDGTPTRWLQFLADTFAGDPDLTAYVQRLLGLSIIGTPLERVLPFAYGAGANGKTTMLDIVMRLLGLGQHGYALAAPSDLLLASKQTGHPTEIARLAGARLVACSELNSGQRFDEARVKLLTGKDVITGRFMRQDFFDFRPTHTLWLLGNHMPGVRDGGAAFWDRLRLLPFLHTVPPDQRDRELADRLLADEGPAILGWLIAGAADYYAHGLDVPQAVSSATAGYETEQDTLGRFVDELCVTGPAARPDLRVKTAVLRESYEKWCRDEGDEPVNAKAFGQALRARFGVTPWRSNGAKYYCGIRVDDVEPLPPEPVDGPDIDPYEENPLWK